MTGHERKATSGAEGVTGAVGDRNPSEAQESGSAGGRHDRGSEADTDRLEVAENHRALLYRSHGATSRDTGRYRSVVEEAERFWSKVDRTAPGGCWLWLGQLNQWGYGHFRRTLAPGQHRTVKAHRLAYTLLVGPIPTGLTLDHLCGRRSCVRPDHLEPVTNAENLRRRHAGRRTEGTTTP
jgi:HNH endonuclease